ncbi:MAG: lamin tail domain-containing protein [Anaerolineae bacterium]|jgi:hypothetical protein|nr:lamin tail domain-containing protein [Anaerolineae bacterium]MBT7072977.1 lamin tail domain-containing protein [Anaerolineae bacterium]MBT7324268.1 lamin tail domain-containing protein [Anaerolineae bacterium]
MREIKAGRRKFFVLLATASVFSIFFVGKVSATPAGDNIIISEVEYDASTESGGEWFELYNPTRNTIDISGWTITDGEGVITFPAGTTIASGNYFLAAKVTADFLSEHTTLSTSDVDLEYSAGHTSGSFTLANSGDELTIANGGTTIDYLAWEGVSGWSILATDGKSVARSSSVDTDLESDWSSNQTPSPGNGNLALLNTAPVNSVPGAQSTDDNSALVFSTVNGNPISISDEDAGSADVQVTLTVTKGSLTLNGTTGITSFSSGDGTTDPTMTFKGPLASINAALDGLKYLPNTGHSGSDSLNITTDDLGASGSGGAQSDNDAVAINSHQ